MPRSGSFATRSRRSGIGWSRRPNGFSLIELVVGMAALGIVLVALTGQLVSQPASVSRINEIERELMALESSLLAAIQNKQNFTSIAARLELGGPFPDTTLSDFSGTSFLLSYPKVIESAPGSSASATASSPAEAPPYRIRGSTQFYNRNRQTCSALDGLECVYQVDLSLIMTRGRPNSGFDIPPPRWIDEGKLGVSRIPSYGFAYRISADPRLGPGSRIRGSGSAQGFDPSDHRLPLPLDHYAQDRSRVDQRRCTDGGIMTGYSPETNQPVCVPFSGCARSQLAKQIISRPGYIGMDCQSFRPISCPANYVVRKINPSLMDGSTPGPVTAGECVYLGKSSKVFAKTDTNSASLRCGKDYAVTASCSLVNEVTSNCVQRDSGGAIVSSVPPASGAARKIVNANGSVECVIDRPNAFCQAPYAEGSWTASVRLDGTCDLSLPETVPLVAQGGG